MRECLNDTLVIEKGSSRVKDKPLNRKEIAEFLRISLVTLNDWVNRELPSHKQRGRVYFDKKEAKRYIRTYKMGQFRFGSRFKTRSADPLDVNGINDNDLERFFLPCLFFCKLADFHRCS